ncbi:hypothetical protein A8144_11275 [Mycobacterium leprae 3125609]|nr:hypothetical protein A8144_11275 [Mycobacterium leprae 3125609]OAX70662.1 hypothetical protein A3216_10695 [Mycobacterium leprae 7935681]
MRRGCQLQLVDYCLGDQRDGLADCFNGRRKQEVSAQLHQGDGMRLVGYHEGLLADSVEQRGAAALELPGRPRLSRKVLP